MQGSQENMITTVIKGICVGGTMLVPGCSDGSMAMILGIYDRLVSSVSSFMKHKKESLCFLALFCVGGGMGMVMQPGPVYDCYQDIVKDMDKKPRVIYMTPQGKVFSQSIAEELSKEEELIFLCGHYEGIDERVLEEIVTDELSIGDYVLTGGELPAMVMIDSISRLIPGVLNNDDSAEYESFQDGLLEYPQYTRPETFMDKKVPSVLLSGHHGNIEKWRREQSLKRTLLRRPELLETAELTDNDKKTLKKLRKNLDFPE